MRRIATRVAAVIACIACAMGVTSSIAIANEPWAITPVDPVNGGLFGITAPTVDGRVGSVAAEFQSPMRLPAGTQAVMEVTAENVSGQDGTLADDKLVSLGTLYARDSDPSRFAGQVSAGAFQHPGTYYFQYRALVHDRFDDGQTWCSTVPSGSGGLCLYVSPVFTFSIQAQAPTPPSITAPTATTRTFRLTRSAAVANVRAYVVRRLKGRRVKAACTRDDASQFTCRVRYIRKNKTRRATIEIYRDEDGLNYERL